MTQQAIKVSSFKDLMSGYEQAQIKCLIHGTTVRTLTKKRLGAELQEAVEIDSDDGHPLTVPIDIPICYEPWDFDRGNMLFHPESKSLASTRTSDAVIASKICTEGDVIVYPDGTEYSIQPGDNVVQSFGSSERLVPQTARVCRPRFESETHALALEGLIDGDSCDDLGRVLQPIVDYLRGLNTD